MSYRRITNTVILLVLGTVYFAQNIWDLPKANSQTGQDQAMLLAYGTISRQVQSILYGPKRIEGEVILQLSSKMQKETVETYISFISADRQSVSNSVYTGRIEPIS